MSGVNDGVPDKQSGQTKSCQLSIDLVSNYTCTCVSTQALLSNNIKNSTVRGGGKKTRRLLPKIAWPVSPRAFHALWHAVVPGHAVGCCEALAIRRFLPSAAGKGHRKRGVCFFRLKPLRSPQVCNRSTPVKGEGEHFWQTCFPKKDWAHAPLRPKQPQPPEAPKVGKQVSSISCSRVNTQSLHDCPYQERRESLICVKASLAALPLDSAFPPLIGKAA